MSCHSGSFSPPPTPLTLAPFHSPALTRSVCLSTDDCLCLAPGAIEPVQVNFELQWQDSRLVDSPCKLVLPNILSLSKEEAFSDIGRNVRTGYWNRYWIPCAAPRIH